MSEIKIAGIMRAGAYSPNHIGNDAAIFNVTADQLRKRGCEVKIYSEEQLAAGDVKEKSYSTCAASSGPSLSFRIFRTRVVSS